MNISSSKNGTNLEASLSRLSEQPLPLVDTSGQEDSINGHIFACPEEVLCSIFLHARNLSIFFDAQAGIKRNPCEVNISHVCRLWRAIALDLPQLWAKFRYSPPVTKRIDICDRFSAYMERSGKQTVDIWFNFRNLHAPQWCGLDDHLTLVQLSVAAADRWRRYTLLTDKDDVDTWEIAFGEYLVDLHAPNLEHFALCPQSSHTPTFVPGLPFLGPPAQILRRGTPVLTSLRLDSTSFRSYVPQIYGQLTTLRIDNPSSYIHQTGVHTLEFTAVLEKCPLQNLSISAMVFLNDLDEVIHRQVTMKHLKEFRCCSPQVTELFQYISTPSLETIVLRDVSFPLLSEISTSSLTTLVLIDCGVSWIELSQDVTYISNRITHLTISEGPTNVFPKYAFQLFGQHWPSLTHFSSNIEMWYDVDFYLTFAELRAENSLTLRVNAHLVLFWEHGSPEGLIRLRKRCLKLEGWDDLNPLVPLHWPYGEDKSDFGYNTMTDYDPFLVNFYH